MEIEASAHLQPSMPTLEQRAAQQAAVGGRGSRPRQMLALPLAFTLLFLLFALQPAARENTAVLWAFGGAGAALLLWNATLLATASRSGRTLTLEVALRKQHYLQACAHLCILAYWGWYWHDVYSFAGFILAQVAFAYAFLSLLTWSRRDTFQLGFGPFPIIFSINLFLWFKLDWFYLQLLLVAVGFLGKEFFRWNKDGQRTHIFNPSSFTLTIFSLGLILTGTSDITWGSLIAWTQFYPPYIYLLIFLVTLPAQYLWGVVTMTLSAAATTYLVGLLYLGLTGHEIFVGSYIQIAVFLSMNLLITDPSTSPRTELGRMIFGALYGLSVLLLFVLLEYHGTPSFYDKLLVVPILNLAIQAIDRVARSPALKRFDPSALCRSLTSRERNLAYMAVWTLFFIGMQYQTSAFRDAAQFDEKGLALMKQGKPAEAIAPFREVVKIRPEYGPGYMKLGRALVEAGQLPAAVAPLRRAAELVPDDKQIHTLLAISLRNARQPRLAVEHFREALRLDPDWLPALIGLAWLQATSPAAFDPAHALRVASYATELTRRRDPAALDVLAVAYAAAGRFPEAIEAAEAAEAIALRTNPKLAVRIRRRLSLYRMGRPYVMPGHA
jgi:tetratricopeptide (TPR) repeat protein